MVDRMRWLSNFRIVGHFDRLLQGKFPLTEYYREKPFQQVLGGNDDGSDLV